MTLKNFRIENLYRGSLPFFLGEQRGGTIFLASSNKNIEDYYYTLKDIYKGKILQIDEFQDENDFYNKNYNLLEILKTEKNYIILLSLSGLLRDYASSGQALSFKREEIINLREIEEKLINTGYTKNYIIEKQLQYSIRGDIFDIFPLNQENPIRIELFGDEIERITEFDIYTQKSIEEKENILMYINKNKDKNLNFLEVLEKNKEKINNLYMENSEVLKYKLEEYILKDRENEIKYREILDRTEKEFIHIESKRFDFDKIRKYEDLEVIKYESKNQKILILSEEKKRYKEIFQDYPNIEVEKHPHYEGFIHEDKLILTDREIKGIKVKREISRRHGLRYDNLSQIREGDYIIHENFGVGQYLGIETINSKDYLKIQYAGEDRLFVPIENLNRIEKYVYDMEKMPEVYKLGRRGFRKKREKLEEEMKVFAKELIAVQAKRKAEIGYSFSKDTVWQEEFEEGFPYTETKDQLEAIKNTKEDMESARVMDRIICGDVGYGKTEVAMRAAFKAVTDGKQVLILAPTTILADQHYQRFNERFQNYPFNLALLSRIKTTKEQKETLNKLVTGGVDIIIGTHRLLSNDIHFQNLGLIIVDEEQKFGVKAKEKLKTMKENVDLLTLTATPIPRTLNLALLGIRDISIIKTPPTERLPIENIIIDKNEKIIREAIMKEISRDGQVFYVYNSIHSIEYRENYLRKILPNYIKIKYIHGRMTPKQIKEVIHEFENGDIDVLLSTTIIENGIDIENANTIIIEGIEKLGLSQIYQLRGRVGRGKRKGYCYLINETDRKYNKKTNLRKESIERLQGLGGGFTLSLEDMNIRGAGEILGERQHGALETFGYNLYVKLLQEEVERQRGEYKNKSDIVIELLENGHIPKDYIEEYEKISIYKRVMALDTIEDIEELLSEVIDRFGRPPLEVITLFENLKIKVKALEIGIKEIKEIEKEKYEISFDNEKIVFEKILNMIRSNKCKLNKKSSILYEKNINKFFEEYQEEEIEGIL